MTRPSLAAPSRLRARHAREDSGLFVLESVPPFLQACAAGIELTAIYHCNILLRSARAQKLVRHKKREGVPTRHLKPEEYRRLSRTSRASGILAVARQPWRSLESLPSDPTPCLVVLEHIRSAGNLGTIIRTAEAAGVPGIVLLDEGCDPFDTPTIRASMGSLFHVPLVRSTRQLFGAWARANGVCVIGTSPGATRCYTALPPASSYAVVLGDEREGLAADTLDACDTRVRIPILGRGDSLNVGVAGGIMIYELLHRTGSRAT